jgi:hypothetical protein
MVLGQGIYNEGATKIIVISNFCFGCFPEKITLHKFISVEMHGKTTNFFLNLQKVWQ